MARWILVNLHHGELDQQRILKRATHDLMCKAAFDGKVPFGQIGMSWFLTEEKGERLVMHTGGDDGFLSVVAMVPARNMGFVLMTNSDRAPLRKIWETTLSTALGR
jgi:CubicO group peptidase (beta-lactamase class C family)